VASNGTSVHDVMLPACTCLATQTSALSQAR